MNREPRIDLHIRFHGPFHVAAGETRDGLDSTVDRQALLPASSVKGVMRRAATELLGSHHRLVTDVFGTNGAESPWAWTSARLSGHAITARTRIRIGETGTVANGALLRQEIVNADHATASVTQRTFIRPDDLDDHLRLLEVSARLVRSLGADRNRGYGWVSVTTDPATDLAALVSWAHANREVAA